MTQRVRSKRTLLCISQYEVSMIGDGLWKVALNGVTTSETVHVPVSDWDEISSVCLPRYVPNHETDLIVGYLLVFCRSGEKIIFCKWRFFRQKAICDQNSVRTSITTCICTEPGAGPIQVPSKHIRKVGGESKGGSGCGRRVSRRTYLSHGSSKRHRKLGSTCVTRELLF
jgi:hypothetical protein